MAEMRVGFPAPDLGTDHHVAEVRLLLDGIFAERTGEARPAAAGIVFVSGTEQRLAGDDIHIDSVAVVIPELVVEGRFRRAVLRDLILQRRQPLFQAGLVLIMLPMALDKGFTAGGFAVALVMAGIFAMITLMIFLRRVKGCCRHNFRYDRSREAAAVLNSNLGGFGLLALSFGVVENSRPVGRASVMELASGIGRIDLPPV
ncbi:hypothetical protein D3C71_1600410 [compost metagenome]